MSLLGVPPFGVEVAKHLDREQHRRTAVSELRNEWLPMYTAPKDGQVDILCYAPGNPRADAPQDQEPLMKVDYFSKGDGAWRRMRPRNPYTHWQPLPLPPPPEVK